MVLPATAVAGAVFVTAKSTVRGALAATELLLFAVLVSLFAVVSVVVIDATLVKFPMVPGSTTPTSVIVV